MAKFAITLPALFGDHHASAVKEILEGLDGINTFYVSSALQQIAADFDPNATTEEAIIEALARAGYQEGKLDEVYPAAPSERATRHTEALSEIIRFTNEAPSWQGKPLWPCPGFEFQPEMEE
jgi:copper chaperone CopZ